MPGRILNFSEFYSKYSKLKKELTLDNVVNSPSNFEDGFDDSTYDQEQMGPNRPVAQSGIQAPSNPGEGGIPKFNVKKEASMNAPEEEYEDDEDDDEAEPESAGVNPSKNIKKEEQDMKKNESRIFTFSEFKLINEDLSGDYDPSEEEYSSNPYEDDPSEEEYSSNPYEDDPEDFCPDCGNPLEGSYTAAANPGMKTCGANPMSSCGANPY
jgi:hypothetical protein